MIPTAEVLSTYLGRMPDVRPDLVCPVHGNVPFDVLDADLFIPCIRLDVEVDGREWHRDMQRDRRRARRLAEEHGVATYRVDARCVWADPLEAARNVFWAVHRRAGDLARREQ